jgi:aryl-alcohol dehydrogenase
MDRAGEGEPVAGAFFGQSSFATHAMASLRNAMLVGDDVDLDTC